ncbi:MAG: hypothetical protein HY078_10495 [Elusimicrobia bacterium]|nr:hypothetical protein [Elusimicrobiota bacterium]
MFFLRLALAAALAAPASAAQPILPEVPQTGDEIPVTEDFFPVHDPTALDARRRTIADAVACARPLLAESVRASGMAGPATDLSDAVCGNAAPKLALLLRWRGLSADLVDNYNHIYIASREPDGVLVVDPTIRQFFGRRSAPADVPEIFIGTLLELKALFARNAESMTWTPGFDSIYFDASRIQNMAMGPRRRSMLAEPRSKENAPLWRYPKACLPNI